MVAVRVSLCACSSVRKALRTRVCLLSAHLPLSLSSWLAAHTSIDLCTVLPAVRETTPYSGPDRTAHAW
eukprot:m.371960 g.371960  ORF g.371960 m.371960 type:complete len:69 (-) comp19992_c0_seq13:100-306(-)